MSAASKSPISYAQNREDIFIAAFFPDVEKGFYVDVGANHPQADSVTQYFYERGWRGINIEPIRELQAEFERVRADDINLGVGIASKAGELEFTEYETDGRSTFSEAVADEYRESQKVKATYTVEVQTLAEVLKKHAKKKIHFLKIDIEGYEYEALDGNDWSKYRPELICIEANHVNRDWRPILKKNDYKLVFFDGLNEYYLEKNSIGRFDTFKKEYPELLVRARIVDIDWQRVIDKLTDQLRRVQSALDERAATAARLENDVKAHQQKAQELADELARYNSITFLVKRLIRRVGAKLLGR